MAGFHLDEHRVLGPNTRLNGAPNGDALHREGVTQSLGDGAARRVVNADDGSGVRIELREDLRLDARVVL